MRHLAQYVLFAVGFSLATAHLAQAQELKLKFEQFTTERGLSQSRVNCIAQDKRGFIWIGTNDGLNRFDGYTFTVYRHDAQNPNSIASDIIQALHCDRNGTLWVGTANGLCKSEDGGKTFITFRPDYTQGGISNEHINVVSEDRWGAIWVGTQDGLCKTIDGGKSFLTFKYEERNSKSISDNNITALCFDSSGTMWVGTQDGLCKSDDGGVSFKTYKQGDGNSISSDTVLSLSIDRFKNLWIGTPNGLCYFNPKTERFVTYFPTLGERIKVFPAIICEQTSNRLWIGTENGGLWLFNAKTKEKKDWRNYGATSGLTDNQIISLYQDRAGLLWVGTVSGGVYLCNPTGSAKFEAIAVNPRRGDKLVVRKVSAIWEESDETLLVGTTDAGLYRYLPDAKVYRRLQVGKEEEESAQKKPAKKKARAQPKKQLAKKGRKGRDEAKPATIDLENAYITALLRDKSGMLWIGTTSGLCVQAQEKGGLRYFFHYPENPKGLCSNEITALYEDQKENLWIGTKNGLCYLAKANKLDTAKGGKMTVFKSEPSKPQTLSSNHITAIFQDKDGAIWVGTSGGGLCKTTDGGATFARMQSEPQNPKSLSSNSIWALCQDASGAIWVGTDGGGLCKTTDGGQTFTAFRERDGLSSDIVYGIFEDSEGFIWLKTRKSITKATPNSDAASGATKPLLFRNYDGLSGVQFGLRNSQLQQFELPSCHKGESGYLYFGGVGVITNFSPEGFREKSYKPPIIITGIAVKETVGDTERDSVIAASEKIVLPYKYNKFSIEYSALAYYEQTKNQYAYKLESFEKNWNYAGARREATYTNLEPGEYTFYVKAAGPDGAWDEAGTKISLEIVPPFWKTFWFQSLATLLGIFSVGGLGYVGYKQRVKVIEARNRELEDKIREATQELQDKNKEIQSQKDELEEKNRNITSSIEYAKTIQLALLPDKERLKAHLPEHFILYKPRDIVSGDFYWFHEEQGKIIFVVADCTGHGVPGAFMSAIGESLLGQIVVEKNIMNPGKILEELHRLVRRALNQNDEIGGSQDGMDVGVIVMEKSASADKRVICFAGARRPLYYTKDGELCEIKPDKSSIGGWQREAERHYAEHQIELKVGEMIYMTTDGYADQPDSQMRVFAAKRLRELLKFIAAKPVEAQLQILDEELKRHQGREAQRDDITVVGIRVT